MFILLSNLQDQLDRSRFGKGKAHKKEVKALIGERKSMKDSLQQVLQKLVLLKDPSPDVDGEFVFHFFLHCPALLLFLHTSYLALAQKCITPRNRKSAPNKLYTIRYLSMNELDCLYLYILMMKTY